MVKKEIVSTRLNSEEGISYTEFSYQILQGLDFLELYRRHACVLQFGGSDQWGNLTSGTELIRKVEGVGVHALGTPLITNSDGTKFGKSEGNAIWLDPELTSPYEFYQFWLNTDDADVCDRLKIFTFRTRAEIEDLIARSAEHPHKRLAQGLLARDVTALVHGEAATNQAVMASAAMFGGAPLEELDRALLQGVLRELPHVTVPWGEGQWGVVELFVRSGLVSSNSAARRNIQEGGAQMNNRKIDDVTTIVQAEELLHGQYLVLSKGKRARAVVEFERSST